MNIITPETIEVVASDRKSQGEFVVINKADYDPKIHKLYKDQPIDAPVKAPEPVDDNLVITPPQPISTLKFSSAAAEKLAEESGVDLTGVVGTAKDGAITKPDVEAAIQAATDEAGE